MQNSLLSMFISPGCNLLHATFAIAVLRCIAGCLFLGSSHSCANDTARAAQRLPLPERSKDCTADSLYSVHHLGLPVAQPQAEETEEMRHPVQAKGRKALAGQADI